MLTQVKLMNRRLEDYRGIIKDDLYEEIEGLAKELKGKKVYHINATPFGGGVAEILKSLAPLLVDVGVEAEWLVVPPNDDFFEVTKYFHNALQGKPGELGKKKTHIYLAHNRRTAREMGGLKPDIWVMHDPQPLPLISYFNKNSKKIPAVWRIHIDLSRPNRKYWEFLLPYIKKYDRYVLSLNDFVQPNLEKDKVAIFTPAIDPLLVKNKELSLKETRETVAGFGINIKRPLITQISRFDLWKDPIGVIEAYRLAKEKIKDLQLVLWGAQGAADDPEAVRVFQEVKKAAGEDSDLFLFSDSKEMSAEEQAYFVNAFQTASDVVLQKSIKEGFGMTATEAMWKGTPVIAGDVGGLRLQIEDGKNGFLVKSPKEAGERIVELLKDRDLARKIGKAGKESVRERFLAPRLLRDHLKLYKELL